MKKNKVDEYPLTAQEIELLRTKLFPNESDRDWEYMEDGIKGSLAFMKRVFIASKLRAGLALGCYGYWPMNEELTVWKASDGSPIEHSFVEMLCHYGTPDDMGQALQMEFATIEEDFIIPKRMGQAEFEDTYM